MSDPQTATDKDAPRRSYLIDMDGVLVHGQRPIEGAAEFIQRLVRGGHKFLILTNNSRYTPVDLRHRLDQAGMHVPETCFFSSAMATAKFVSSQKSGGDAFVIGDTGLFQALHNEGYSLTDYNPDFVVLGEMESYPYDKILRAVDHIIRGVPFIATNPDTSGPTEKGIVPACGAVASLLEQATGHEPYFIGKPNPLMMRLALRYMDEHSENATMIGDRMDTDVRVGLESGLETILALSGLTRRDMIERFAYRPHRVVDSVAEIEP